MQTFLLSNGLIGIMRLGAIAADTLRLLLQIQIVELYPC